MRGREDRKRKENWPFVFLNKKKTHELILNLNWAFDIFFFVVMNYFFFLQVVHQNGLCNWKIECEFSLNRHLKWCSACILMFFFVHKIQKLSSFEWWRKPRRILSMSAHCLQKKLNACFFFFINRWENRYMKLLFFFFLNMINAIVLCRKKCKN